MKSAWWFTPAEAVLCIILGVMVVYKLISWAKDSREGLLHDCWRNVRDGDLWVISSLNVYCWTLTGFFLWKHGKLVITAYLVTVVIMLCLSVLTRRRLISPLKTVVSLQVRVLWGFFPATVLGSWEIFDGLMTRRKTRYIHHPTLPIRRIPSR